MSGEVGPAEFAGAGEEFGGDADAKQEGAFLLETVQGRAADGEQGQQLPGGVAVRPGQDDRRVDLGYCLLPRALAGGDSPS